MKTKVVSECLLLRLILPRRNSNVEVFLLNKLIQHFTVIRMYNRVNNINAELQCGAVRPIPTPSSSIRHSKPSLDGSTYLHCSSRKHRHSVSSSICWWQELVHHLLSGWRDMLQTIEQPYYQHPTQCCGPSACTQAQCSRRNLPSSRTTPSGLLRP